MHYSPKILSVDKRDLFGSPPSAVHLLRDIEPSQLEGRVLIYPSLTFRRIISGILQEKTQIHKTDVQENSKEIQATKNLKII